MGSAAGGAAFADPAPVFATVTPAFGATATPSLRLEQDPCYQWGAPSITVEGGDVRVTQSVTPVASCAPREALAVTIALPSFGIGAHRLTYVPQPIGFGPMPVSVVEFNIRDPGFPGFFVAEPADPVALEPIHLRFSLLDTCDSIHGVRLVDSAFRIELDRFQQNAFLCDTGEIANFTLGSLAPGTYRIELAYLPEDGGALIDFIDVTVRPGRTSTAFERGRPVQDLAGLWVSPNEEPSTGITFIHTRLPLAPGDSRTTHGLIGIWYRYGPDGSATWYWLEARAALADGVFAGPVYVYTTPNAAAPGWQRAVARTEVGSMSIRFGKGDALGGLDQPARVDADLEGKTLAFSLQRFRWLRAAWPALPD